MPTINPNSQNRGTRTNGQNTRVVTVKEKGAASLHMANRTQRTMPKERSSADRQNLKLARIRQDGAKACTRPTDSASNGKGKRPDWECEKRKRGIGELPDHKMR